VEKLGGKGATRAVRQLRAGLLKNETIEATERSESGTPKNKVNVRATAGLEK